MRGAIDAQDATQLGLQRACDFVRFLELGQDLRARS